MNLARLAALPLPRLENLPIGEAAHLGLRLVGSRREWTAELLTAAAGRIPVAVSSSPLRDRQGHSLGRIVVVRDLPEVADLRHRLVTSARFAASASWRPAAAHER
jgi:hypothetical protein